MRILCIYRHFIHNIHYTLGHSLKHSCTIYTLYTFDYILIIYTYIVYIYIHYIQNIHYILFDIHSNTHVLYTLYTLLPIY
jgi:hypothetical protein